MNSSKIFAAIKGTGSCLPEKVITNSDLEEMVDTSDEWIVTRTGIKERRILEKGKATSDMATSAALNAIEDAGIKPEDLDLIVVSTVTPDMIFPSTACLVQKNIGAVNAAAFDIEAACTGFIYAITIASQFIENGFYKNVLVISAETLSRITDWEDRNTCVLFGDGAGAVVLGKSEKAGILSSYLQADGNGAEYLYSPAGGSRIPASIETVEGRMHYINMNGNDVFKFAVKAMPEAVMGALEKCNLGAESVDLFIPHQANIRIIESASRRLGIPMEKVAVTIDKYGNNSSATIPIALDEYNRAGKLKNGDVIAAVGFGAGLTWGSSIIIWQK